jgi:thiol-disulfide isomerase/thioredoxin
VRNIVSMRLLGITAGLIGMGILMTSSLTCADTKKLTGQERAEAVGRGLVGSPAPKLVLKTIDGDEIDLGKLYGKKAVYLEFWATWCVPCRQQMPHLEKVYQAAGPDLAVIAVNAGFNDSLDDVQTYRRKIGITMPIVIDDGKLGEAFNLRVTPQHIVIGRDGRIQYVGHFADDRLDAALLAARTPQSTQLPSSPNIAPGDTPQYAVGDRLPDISATTLQGHAFRSRDSAVKYPTVFVFISPWCESYLATSRPSLSTSCRQVREQIDSLSQSVRARWLGIASGLWATKEDLSAYEAQYKTKIPLALDESGVWFRSFRVMNVPTVLIADANGKIVRRIEGFDSGLSNELRSIASK